MPIKVHHAIIHGFTKNANGPVQDVRKTEVLLQNDMPSVKSLVHGMAALFGKKGNSQEFGHFGDEKREGRFPDAFDAYVGTMADGAKFLDLSHIVLDEVTARAEAEKWATGGHILCALYEFVRQEDVVDAGRDGADAGDAAGHADAEAFVGPQWEGTPGEPYCLVAMVKQKGGLSLDANLVPVGINEVDMSKLHQAALIQVKKYLEVKALPPAAVAAIAGGDGLQQDHDGEDDPHDRIYLSFVAQNANRSAHYFINALGCVVGLTSLKATNNLFKAVAAFFDEHKPLQPHLRKVKEGLVAHLERAVEQGNPVTVAGLRDVMLRDVPAELAPELDNIEVFLNDAKHQVPASFVVNKGTVSRFKSVVLTGDGYQLRFDRSLLGQDANADFYYNKKEKTLTIRNLSNDLLVKLDGVIAAR